MQRHHSGLGVSRCDTGEHRQHTVEREVLNTFLSSSCSLLCMDCDTLIAFLAFPPDAERTALVVVGFGCTDQTSALCDPLLGVFRPDGRTCQLMLHL
jgi:hypothetical protein